MTFNAYRESAKEATKAFAHETVLPDGIVCLLDNRKTRDLKRHLMVFHNRTVEDYKAEFGLPDDYPVTFFAGKRSTPLTETAVKRRDAVLAR